MVYLTVPLLYVINKTQKTREEKEHINFMSDIRSHTRCILDHANIFIYI